MRNQPPPIPGVELRPVKLLIDRIDAGKAFSVVTNGQKTPILFMEVNSKRPGRMAMPVYARALKWCKENGVDSIIYWHRSKSSLWIAPVSAFPPLLPILPDAAYSMPLGNRLVHKRPWFDVPDHCESISLYDSAAASEQAAMWGEE